ncbi:alpha/beta hydrolase [Mycobacterium sp. M26]|uniref:alpha/beta fold hydrolase n=1 Tax=Mycobacterium sp. M26 TaxID=1762962 RepID=UPI00073F6CE3|nr:alpha/beta hydrolase [Mycobacterium sp. M26]
MTTIESPESSYTRTWAGDRGEVRHFVRADGSRLRYYTTGTGPPLVLIHTVRTQLDYFQRVIPRLLDRFTVYAVDLPGMGWSDIVANQSFEEADFRSAIVDFVQGLDLRAVTLAGESLGGAVALLASIDLGDRVSRVVALNPYDYPSGLIRGSFLGRLIIPAVRLPVVGPLIAGLEPRPVMRRVLRGGLVDGAALPEELLDELLRSGRRKGYDKVARGVYRSLPGFIRARSRYPEVGAPVTLVYSDGDWSRPAERDQVENALRRVERVNIPLSGHFASLEKPEVVAAILNETVLTDLLRRGDR